MDGRRLDELMARGWTTLPIDADLERLFATVEAEAAAFFASPLDVKAALDIRSSVGHRGWVPVDEAGAYADEGPRRYEAFDIGREPREGDHITHPLRGPNRWPTGDSGGVLRDAATALFERLSSWSDQIGASVCTHLGVDPRRFAAYRSEPVSQLRMIHYLSPPSTAPHSSSDANPAMGAHTDYEFFTLLHQSQPGTQVLEHDGTWTSTPAGSCVTLLAGDMLEVFSDREVRSVLHRAAPDVAPGRISIPFFAGADYTAVVTPHGEPRLPGATGESFGEHLMTQLERDFPYLRDRNGTADIDLTATDRRSPFESAALERLEATTDAEALR